MGGRSWCKQGIRYRTRQEYEIVEELKDKYPVIFLCQLMGVNKSGYYKWRNRQGTLNRYEKDRLLLTSLLEQEHKKHPSHGYHRLADDVFEQTGWVFSHMRKRIAHRLQDRRMNAKLTQQELSLKVDINHLTYRGYENCRSDIPIVYLIRLADFFGVSLDYLTGRVDNKSDVMPVKAANDEISDRVKQLEQIVAKLQAQSNHSDL